MVLGITVMMGVKIFRTQNQDPQMTCVVEMNMVSLMEVQL